MTKSQLPQWALCTGISVGLHAALFWGLAQTVEPKPTPQQNPPASKLTVDAYSVDQAKAKQTPAIGESAAQARANPTDLQSNVIPQSTAKASTLKPTKVKPSSNTAQTIKPSNKNIPTLEAAVSPQVIVSKSLATGAVKTQTVAPSGYNIPSADTASFSKPSQSITPSSERAKAALAWVGDDGNIDPVSLNAIQAFMQPSDLDISNSSAGNVRDGIEGVLEAVPCSRLQTSFNPDTGSLEVKGHIPEDGLRAPILAALQEQVGGAIPITQTLVILPRPQCGALSGIASVDLPQSNEQETNPKVIGPSGFARNYQYSEGQRLELELSAPDYDAVIYVDYFTADGTVLHLQPNNIVPLQTYKAKSAFSVGKELTDGPSLNLTITPPFGQEIAVAFASSVPLFAELRPISEPAEPYLKALKERVAVARKNDSNFKGEWVYFFIATTP